MKRDASGQIFNSRQPTSLERLAAGISIDVDFSSVAFDSDMKSNAEQRSCC